MLRSVVRASARLSRELRRYDRLADPPKDADGSVMPKYGILDRDGLAHVGEQVNPGQVFINKQIGRASCRERVS